jgi:hypothetical protein
MKGRNSKFLFSDRVDKVIFYNLKIIVKESCLDSMIIAE